MKFFFLKTDSLYKIFKTLEKIPPQKSVEIFIDPEHPFFDNAWRGKQVKELIEERKLNIIFLAEKESSKKYFQQLGLRVSYQDEKPIVKILKTVSLFLFDIKKFHLHTYNKQKYIFYMVFAFEILAGVALLWFLVMLIVPSAKITLKVAQQTEDIIYNFRYYPAQDASYLGEIKQISIPYYTGSLDYTYQLSVSTENIRHIINPSEGTVKIYNKTSNALNLLENTRFVTADGLVFLSRGPITIPAGLPNAPSEIRVQLYADQTDEYGNIIGARGNIPKNTRLLIKNIKDSFYLGQIWAETIEPFDGGSATSLGTVSEKDRTLLAEKIKSGVYADKLNILQNNFQVKGGFPLMFDKLIRTQFNALSVDGKIGEATPSLKGQADITLHYFYLHRSDIVTSFTQYVQERQSDSIQLISINPNSLAFIDDMRALGGGDVFVIPTKVTVFQGYDFKRDVKNIIPTIKSLIAGKSVEEARRIILQYSEIASVKLNLGFLQGDKIPTIKSRIKVNVQL